MCSLPLSLDLRLLGSLRLRDVDCQRWMINRVGMDMDFTIFHAT